MGFKDKVVVVTGGSRGIGKAIVEDFVAQGAWVVVNYCQGKSQAQKLCKKLRQKEGRVMCLQADVSCHEAVVDMVDNIIDRWHRIDIWVNNAGWAKQQSLADIDPADFNKQLQINIAGIIYCAQAFAPVMSQHGRVINISSLAAKGGALFPVYSATKAACNALTRSLASELGDRQITVNAVAPAAVETDLYYSVGLDQHKKAALATTPLGFLGDVSDVAKAVLFFASEEARWITGETLYVSGGRNM